MLFSFWNPHQKDVKPTPTLCNSCFYSVYAIFNVICILSIIRKADVLRNINKYLGHSVPNPWNILEHYLSNKGARATQLLEHILCRKLMWCELGVWAFPYSRLLYLRFQGLDFERKTETVLDIYLWLRPYLWGPSTNLTFVQALDWNFLNLK